MTSHGRPPGGAVVEITDFGWRHAGRKNPAIANITACVEPGERVLLLGASGAGKSTLLAGIAGVLGDAEDGEQRGTIRVDGKDPAQARGLVGMVLQDPDSQVIAARVGDDAVFGCENLGIPREEMWQRATDSLRTVGLGELDLDRSTHRLSGGQKQRLALAGVLAMRPRVIVLDEPTANLDPEGVAEVRDAVIRACEETGATLIVVEHRAATWAGHVDRVLVLGETNPSGVEEQASAGRQAGGVLADGPAREILDTHADRLAESGIWVPGVSPALRRMGTPPPELGAMKAAPGSTGHQRHADNGGDVDHLVDAAPAHRERNAQTSGKPLLRTQNLAIGWGDHAIRTGITAALEPGSTCLTGGNGTGKSTLALTLAGLVPAGGGELDAGGLQPAKPRRRETPDPRSWRSKDLVRRIGYVFQSPEHQLAARTVRDELLLGPKAAGMDAAAAEHRADELLGTLGLTHLAAANPFTLSGGEKRRLSVAAVLATEPRLLILDEPTFGQDLNTFTALVGLLQQLADSGMGLLSITHDADYFAALGQHHWHLPQGPGLEVRA